MTPSFESPVDDPDRSYYEGHELQTSTFPIRVLNLLGIKTCISKTMAAKLHNHC